MHGPEVGTTCLEAIYKNERIKNGVVGPVGPVRYLCTPHSRVMVITGRFMDRLSAISVAVISVGFCPAESEGTNRSAFLHRAIGLGLGLFLFTHMSNLAKRLQDHSRKTDVYWGWVKGRARNLGLHE